MGQKVSPREVGYESRLVDCQPPEPHMTSFRTGFSDKTGPLTAWSTVGVQCGLGEHLHMRLFRKTENTLLYKLTQNSMLVLALSAFVFAGCEPTPAVKAPPGGQASGHEHGNEHAEPATLAEAVTQLNAHSAAIKAAFEKNDAQAADEPLHDVMHVLEHLPELVEKLNLDDAGKASAKTATDAVNAAFEAIHDGMHGGTPGKKYADVAESLEGGLKTLDELAKPKG
jgi:hypothetical protein